MSDECNNRMKLEEKIYWSHFQYVQFFQILPQNCEEPLALPKKFVKNMGDKLGKKGVFLKVPSGATWNVGIISRGDSLFLKLGWKEFIEENSLKENDILMFKYIGNSLFDVLLFDGENFCEKECSYFVTKCEHTELSKGCKRVHEHEPSSSTVPVQEISSDIQSLSFDDSTESSPPTKRPKKEDSEPQNPVAPRSRANTKTRGRKKSSTYINHAQNAEKLEFLSNRRPVTEEEKKNAERIACEAATSDDSLVLVMQSYNVYRSFYLTIPSRWLSDRFPWKSMTITLQANGKVWKVKFLSKISGGMLTTGWKQFVFENRLEEFDVCVFKLAARSKSNAVVMDVSIFRVVADAIPPTATRPCPRPRGRPPKGLVRTE